MDNEEIPLAATKITSLLAKALPGTATRDVDNTVLISQLERFNYFSVFDVVNVGKMRFIRRHKHHFSGHAEEIYQNSLSFATQLILASREQGLRTADGIRRQQAADGSSSLPDYASLFPEPWDNFCKVGALEALNSPIAYLLELYQFARQLELDATGDALTLDQRRPDLASLVLDADNTHKDIPAIQVVNEILEFLAADYIDTSMDTGKSVNQVLGETCYPFGLPFSLPMLQITLGLAQSKTSLSQIIRSLSAERPWFGSAMVADQQNSSLLAATRFTQEQMKLICAPAPFAMENLALPVLRKAYLSASTTEMLPNQDLSAHGYVIPLQTGASGPSELTYNPLVLPADTYDTVSVTCTNAQGESVDIKLQGKELLSYKRVKARLKAFADSPPYPRQLELGWRDTDNAGVDLSKGPYRGKLMVHVKDWTSKKTIKSINFAITLSEAPGTPEDDFTESAEFFMRFYGITPEQIKDLPQIKFFMKQVGCTAQELDQALALGDYSPVVSPSITFTNPILASSQRLSGFPEPYHAGAVYLNSGHPEAIGITATRPRSMTHCTAYRFDRLSRLLRLQRWMKLPHYQLDLLVTSAIHAEGQHNLEMNISFNTLRALGIYRHLADKVHLEPESFAALIYSITPFGLSGSSPFFDRVFNQPQLFDTPLLVDNKSFDYTARQGDDTRTIKQLCAGLKINTATFQIVAERVNRAFALEKHTLVRSLENISALYRLVTIARLFKLTPEQGIMIVDILSHAGGFDPLILSGNTSLSPLAQDRQSTTTVDIIDVIYALEEMTDWLKQSKLTPEEISLIIQQQRLPVISTDNTALFFDSILSGLSDTRLTPMHFIAPDLPTVDPTSWMSLLSTLVSMEGLVKPFPLVWASDDVSYLTATITPIVEQSAIPPDRTAAAVSALVQIILQAKTLQEGLVSSAINKEYGVARETVPLLLRWVGYSVAEFLQMLLAQAKQYAGRIRQAAQVNDELLELSYNLAMNGLLIKQLRLSSAFLLMRLAKPEWFNLLAPVRGTPLSLQEVYLSSRYRAWVTAVQHSEDELLDYLGYANTPSWQRNQSDVNRNCAEMLAEILEWDPDEVEQACFKLTPARACSMEQIDWLRRVMALSRQTGLSTTSLLEAAQLPALPSFTQIKSVGEAVIAATQAQRPEQLS